MTSTRHSTAARTGISSVIPTDDGFALTAPARLCFLVEERYDNHVMPGAVVDVLRSWGPHVDVLRPNGRLADLWELIPTDSTKYDAFVLKTVSGGPGLSVLVQPYLPNPGYDVKLCNPGEKVFATLPEAATRLARTVLRLTRRAARAATTLTFAPVQEATA